MIDLCIPARNKDLTWPEEMYQLARNRSVEKENGILLMSLSISNISYIDVLRQKDLCILNSIFHWFDRVMRNKVDQAIVDRYWMCLFTYPCRFSSLASSYY